MRKGILLAAALLLIPGISQAKSLEELLVEKGVITKSEARASHHMGGAKVYWNNGTRIDFADTGFTLRVNTQVQTRYEFTDVSDDNGLPNNNTSSFELSRARLNFNGTALHEEFSYRLELEFSGGNDDGNANAGDLVRDAWISWHPCDGSAIRMGQQRVGLSRQYSTPFSHLQFADRSVASEAFDRDRNTGLRLVQGLMDDKLVLTGAIFNGNSSVGTGAEARNSQGVDTHHALEAGLRYDLMGSMNAFEEGDVGNTEEAALNAGFTYYYSDDTSAALADDLEVHAISTDINYKNGGISFHGEFFWESNETDTTTAVDSDALGFYAQLGFFVMPKRAEIALRYAYLDCDSGAVMDANCMSGSGALDQVQEVSATFNYYWWKHNLKAQAGYVFLNQEPVATGLDDENVNRWILQISSYF